MLRNILLYMTMAVLALTQQGCSSDDDTFSARQGEHTILIYMAAENNLTADVMRNLQELKFIFADCCNFMCLESIYELRQVADYIIGSPAEIPEIGAPYTRQSGTPTRCGTPSMAVTSS